MITTDDARHTIELEDRYVIQPDFSFWRSGQAEYENATPVPQGFYYSSDNNADWLDEDGIRDLLEKSVDN